jgi:hypothetical protein
MTTSIIKNKLHDFIERADINELKKVFSFVEHEFEQSLHSIWEDGEFLKDLEKRSEEIKTGKVQGVSWDQIRRNASLRK